MAYKNRGQEQTLDLGDVAEKNPPRASRRERKIESERYDEGYWALEPQKTDKMLGLKIVVCILVLLNAFFMYAIYMLNQAVNNTYVYNMEAVLMQSGLADENRKFETNMANLETEIDKAEKKVKSMKDEKLKKEYREMYMKSLTLKRDTLIEEHEKFMKSLLKNINKTLAEVANNYGVKVIFNNKSVVFSTNYVTDITPIVSAKLKARMEDD